MNDPYINEYGDKYWYNDKWEWHREDGPAFEYKDGTKYWCINGKFHREDGPAIENDEDKEWWYNDKCIGRSREGFTQEDFERFLKIKEYW